MNGDVKLSFVRQKLEEYMQEVREGMRRAIVRSNVRETDTLLHSLTYRVYQRDADGNATLSFAEWGRYLDMGVGRGHPLSGLAGTKQALIIAGEKKAERIRKPKKVYSPIAYGKLNGLIGDLAYGFTEEVQAAIKTQLHDNAIFSPR